MAKCTVKMPEDFLMKISKLGKKTDEIVAKVLRAGAEVVEEKARSNLQSVIGNNTKYESRSTGELLSSLGITPVDVDEKGVYNVKVGFMEPRSDDNVNAKIGNVLEYGKHGQPPKPFMKPAESATRKSCKEAMKKKLDEEISKL